MSATLDTRTWLIWGFACMLPLLVSRNPWITLEIFLVVVIVRNVAVPVQGSMRTGWFIRVAAVMALVGALFNLVTVRAGDLVLLELPTSWPVIGGAWTLNALVFGLVAGATLFVLVLAGITTANLIRWMDLFHVLPKRLAPIAITGSVAWAFLPQTAVAWNDIRDTRAMRGHRIRGIRDMLPIVVPLLASGLERSLIMAEALEARGFGNPPSTKPNRWSVASPLLLVAGLVGLATASFQIATGHASGAALTGLVAILFLMLAGRLSGSTGPAITTYDERRFHRADAAVMVASGVATVTTLAWLWRSPVDLTFDFYPSLGWPAPVPILLLALSGLMLPALVTQSAPTPR